MATKDYRKPVPTNASKAAIQRAAEDFAKRNGVDPQHPMEALVARYGGRLHYRSYSGPMRDRESIVVHGDGDFDIYLPDDTPALRDRFTIAHELGHYFLHYPMVTREAGRGIGMKATRFVDESERPLVRCEWEANWFAAALLMPEDSFREIWQEAAGEVEKVARHFYVSSAAAETRARSLGLT